MSFEKLLEEAEKLQKSLAAGGEPKVKDPDEDEEDEEEEEEEEEEGGGKPMGKALTVTLAGGEKVRAVDGTKIVKALRSQTRRLVKANDQSLQMIKSLAATVTTVTEALAAQTAKNSEVATENASLKTQLGAFDGKFDDLKKSIDAIGDAGRGRKSATVVLPNTSEGKPQQIEPREFMRKALAGQKKGRLNALDVVTAEACLGKGVPVPDELIQRVMDSDS